MVSAGRDQIVEMESQRRDDLLSVDPAAAPRRCEAADQCPEPHGLESPSLFVDIEQGDDTLRHRVEVCLVGGSLRATASPRTRW